MANPSSKSANTSAKKSSPIPSNSFFRRNRIQVILVVLCFLVFGNGIFNKYALDDEFYTTGENKLTNKGFSGIPEIWKSRTFFNNDGTGYDFRPVVLTTFAIEIAIFGEHPVLSHFINVCLYALTIVLLFHLLRMWFKDQGDWLPFLVCLLYLVHPLHTEVVDNIKCRDELLSHLGAFLAMFFAWKHYETKKIKYLFYFPLAFLFGILSKHTIAPYLLFLPLSFWFFSTMNWKRILLYIIPLLVLVVVASRSQQHFLPEASRHFLTHENPFIDHPPSFLVKTATASHVIGRYLWLHLIPHPLVYYYGFRYVPIVDWSDLIAIVSLLIHLFLAWIAFRELRKKSILGFGLLFYLINIAVYSNMLQPAPGLMAERFTYSSTLGFCIVAVVLLFRFFKTNPVDFDWKSVAQKSMRYTLLAVVVLFALRSVVRNEDWEDKLTLYGNDMEYLRSSAKANMLYGSLCSSRAVEMRLQANGLMNQNRQAEAQPLLQESRQLLLEARVCFDSAASVFPEYPKAWSNWGTTYFFLDDFASAKPLFKKAVSIDKDYTEGYYNLGMTYGNLKNIDSAEWCYRQAIRTDSAYAPPYDQLSRILAGEKRFEEGMILVQTMERNFPNTDKPMICLSTMQLAQGDTTAAATTLEEAARRNPSDLQRLSNLMNYFRIKGNAEKQQYYATLLQQQEALKQRDGRKRSKK